MRVLKLFPDLAIPEDGDVMDSLLSVPHEALSNIRNHCRHRQDPGCENVDRCERQTHVLKLAQALRPL